MGLGGGEVTGGSKELGSGGSKGLGSGGGEGLGSGGGEGQGTCWDVELGNGVADGLGPAFSVTAVCGFALEKEVGAADDP